MDSERVLTQQAAEILRLSADRVRDLVDEGVLPAVRVGRVRLIDKKACEDLARERRQSR